MSIKKQSGWIWLCLALFPGLAMAQDDLDRPLSEICIHQDKGANEFKARLIYGGPPGKPLLAAADGVVVFADWISGDGGYRALVLMVEYAIPNQPGCLVGYRGEMKDHKNPGQTFRRGEVLGVWAPVQAKNDKQ